MHRYFACKSTHFPLLRHGLEAHSSVSFSHLCPEYPLRQWQIYWLISSSHDPPLRHGLEEHSSTSDRHREDMTFNKFNWFLNLFRREIKFYKDCKLSFIDNKN